MKFFKLYLIKSYLRLGLFFYFKKVKVYGIKNITKDKPVLLLSNHQNALLDAIIIATSIKGFAHYLTRASVFKNHFVSKILQNLQLIPVYRIRDGYNNLATNNTIFDRVADFLNSNETVTLFPEGSHSLDRRVRPLSKGFTRIIYNVLEKNPMQNIQLIPIGLNFENAKNCPDSAAIFFGKPICTKDYISENKNESIVRLKQEVSNSIAELTTNIPIENYNKILEKLEDLKVDFLDPKSVNKCIINDFKNCKIKAKNSFSCLKVAFKYMLILNLLLPYGIWKFIVQPKISELEFVSTFRFAIAVTLVPIYLLLLGISLAVLISFKIAVLYSIMVLIVALIAIKL